jgi:hypothetical protein
MKLIEMTPLVMRLHACHANSEAQRTHPQREDL